MNFRLWNKRDPRIAHVRPYCDARPADTVKVVESEAGKKLKLARHMVNRVRAEKKRRELQKKIGRQNVVSMLHRNQAG